MIISISLLHALLSLILLGISIYILYKGRKSILAVTVIGFILIDSIGVALAPYLPLSDIVYLNSPSFVINEKNEDLYLSQVISHWVFFGVALLFLIAEMARKNKSSSRWVIQSNIKIDYRYVVTIFITLGLIAYLRYFIYGPGLAILKSTQIQFSSTSNAIQARSELRNLLETGQGAYMAAMSAKILFPLSSIILFTKRDKFRYIIWLLCALLSLAYAFQTREKSPLVVALMIYSMMPLIQIAFYTKSKPIFRFSIKSTLLIFSLAVVAFYLIGTLLYVINFGLSFSDALESIIARTLAIPAATEANFFFVFPNKFEFRGLEDIFKIPLMGFDGNDISIFQIAYAATGNIFATNASFLAVAWSGGGYFGVAAISLILCGLLSFIDKKMFRMNYGLFISCILLSIPSFIGLSSGSFLDYVGWGGILSPLLMLMVAERTMPNSYSTTANKRVPPTTAIIRGSKS